MDIKNVAMKPGHRLEDGQGGTHVVILPGFDFVLVFDENNCCLKKIQHSQLESHRLTHTSTPVEDVEIWATVAESGKIFTVDGKPYIRLDGKARKPLLYPLDLPEQDLSQAKLAHTVLNTANEITLRAAPAKEV